MNKAIEELDNRLDKCVDAIRELALLFEDGLTIILKVLKDEELLTYEQYADLKEILSEIRETINKNF